MHEEVGEVGLVDQGGKTGVLGEGDAVGPCDCGTGVQEWRDVVGPVQHGKGTCFLGEVGTVEPCAQGGGVLGPAYLGDGQVFRVRVLQLDLVVRGKVL